MVRLWYCVYLDVLIVIFVSCKLVFVNCDCDKCLLLWFDSIWVILWLIMVVNWFWFIVIFSRFVYILIFLFGKVNVLIWLFLNMIIFYCLKLFCLGIWVIIVLVIYCIYVLVFVFLLIGIFCFICVKDFVLSWFMLLLENSSNWFWFVGEVLYVVKLRVINKVSVSCVFFIL